MESVSTRDRIATHQRVLMWLADPRCYALLFVAAVGVVLLGFWGYWWAGDGSHSASDAVYASIKLFAWGASIPPEPHVGLALNLARFLAPVVAGWAAGIALVSLLRDRLQQLRIPFIRGHVVVCGLGYVGLEFVRKLHRAGRRVVVVEADAGNPQINICHGWGFPVVIGDAQSSATLAAAGVKRAARVLAVTSDNAVNTEIVTRASLLVDSERRARTGRLFGAAGTEPLRCLARVDNQALWLLMRTGRSNRGEEDSVIDFFNADEVGARLLLDAHPIGATGRPHIVVAHLSPLGSALVFYAARRWHAERGGVRHPLHVTVVDERAEEQLDALLGTHPSLSEVCEFHCRTATIRDIDLLAAADRQARLARPSDRLAAPAISAVYVTGTADEQTITTALNLRREIDESVPVTAALSRSYAVADLFAGSTGAAEVAIFKTTAKVCTVELVDGGSFEGIAQEIHRRYCAMQPPDQQPPLWEFLDESLKESSRAQARHIGTKLRSIGCEIVPLRSWDAERFTFTDAELRRLAIMEHDRWQREKLSAGWTLGPENPRLRRDPHLVPWDDLPADIADWDRRFVQAIPAMLAAVGLQIVDVRGGPPRYPGPAVADPAGDGNGAQAAAGQVIR